MNWEPRIEPFSMGGSKPRGVSVVDGLRQRKAVWVPGFGPMVAPLTVEERDLLLDVVEALKKSEATLRAMGMPIILDEALAALESAQGAEQRRQTGDDAMTQSLHQSAQGAERPEPEPGEGA